MKYTTRQSTLALRGRATIQTDRRTRDEIQALASKHNISQGVMLERLTMAWLAEERRVKRMIGGEG
jgi:hypothetical protein